jgi:hypothetical protein
MSEEEVPLSQSIFSGPLEPVDLFRCDCRGQVRGPEAPNVRPAAQMILLARERRRMHDLSWNQSRSRFHRDARQERDESENRRGLSAER